MRARSKLCVLSLAVSIFAAYSVNSLPAASIATISFARTDNTSTGHGEGATSSLESLIGAASAPASGSAGAESAGPAFVPIVPALLDYEYADKYLLQFIDTIPGYRLIEATISQSTP